MSEADFEAAGGLARIINGEIFLGKTDAEKRAEENELRIAELKRYLADTDYIAVKDCGGCGNRRRLRRGDFPVSGMAAGNCLSFRLTVKHRRCRTPRKGL
jgi:hypothetical protein